MSDATLLDLFDDAPVGYLTTDCAGAVLGVNRILCEWTGFSAEQLLGRKWFEVLLTQAGRILLDTHIEPLMRLQGSARGISMDCLCADGSRIGILLYVSAQKTTDGIPFLWLTLVEATDRQNYERRLLDAKHAAEDASESLRELTADLELRVEQRTAALQAANEELDAFSYTVSHDLRSPLRALIGFSSALREDFADNLNPDGREYLSRIDEASRQMSDLIEGLLELSQATRSALSLQTIDVTGVALGILQQFARMEPGRHVNSFVEPALSARADPRLLDSLLRNLLGNAWKYTARVPQGIIRVYAETHAGKRCLCVTDNGAGFDSQAARNLFQPFTRQDGSEGFAGMGIGLSTVKRIVARHGGTIEVDAAPGCGATFRVWLPPDESN